MADNRYHIEKEIARRLGLTKKQVNQVMRSRDKLTRTEMEKTRDDEDYEPRSIHYHKIGYFQHKSVTYERFLITSDNLTKKIKKREEDKNDSPITF